MTETVATDNGLRAGWRRLEPRRMNEAKVVIPLQHGKTVQLPARLQILPETCAVIVVNIAK